MAQVNNEAPGELEQVRTFVNSWNPETGIEALSTPLSARSWLVERALLPKGTRFGVRELTETIELREALRALLYANNGGPLDRAALETINRFATRAPVTISFEADVRPRLSPAERGTSGLVGNLLGIVTESIARGTWPRFKSCAAEDCRWAFYDHSRNRSQTWCEMATCGNRAKARAYRRRHQRS